MYFGRQVVAIVHGDVEVGDLTLVLDVSCRGCLGLLLVLQQSVFESMHAIAHLQHGSVVEWSRALGWCGRARQRFLAECLRGMWGLAARTAVTLLGDIGAVVMLGTKKECVCGELTAGSAVIRCRVTWMDRGRGQTIAVECQRHLGCRGSRGTLGTEPLGARQQGEGEAMGVSQMDSLRTVSSYWESLYTQGMYSSKRYYSRGYS